MAKTYGTYKDSGIAWIGEIPGEWEVLKNKYTYSFIYSGGTPTASEEKYYSDEGFAFVSISDMSTTEYVKETKKHLTNEGIANKNLKVLPEGTVLFSIYATVGAVSELLIEATISQAILAIGLKKEIDKSYYKYNLKSMKDYIFSQANGNTQFNLNAEKVANFTICFPPLSVQQSISSFLDTKCGEIDSLISIQEEMISELLAYKQSVITEAVTKGLDKKAKMKNSGVEWIGDIPEEWEIKPYKAIFYTEKGLNITKADLVEKGEPVLSYGQIHSKMNTGTKINDALLKYVPSSYIETNPECLVQKGCFLIADTSEDYDGCGNAIYVDKDMTLFAGYHTIVARPIHNNGDYKYLAYLFLTDIWRQQIRSRVSGIKVYSINQKIIRLTSVLLPPLPVQQAIATYLDEKTSQIDLLIALKQSKIESLKEYKKSIIYEYVTGKKRV